MLDFFLIKEGEEKRNSKSCGFITTVGRLRTAAAACFFFLVSRKLARWKPCTSFNKIHIFLSLKKQLANPAPETIIVRPQDNLLPPLGEVRRRRRRRRGRIFGWKRKKFARALFCTLECCVDSFSPAHANSSSPFPDLGNATSGEHDFSPSVPPRTNWRAREKPREEE